MRTAIRTRLISIAGLAVTLGICGCASWRYRTDPQADMHGSRTRSIQGKIYVKSVPGGTHFQGKVTGLVPGPYGLYLSQSGTCGQPAGMEKSGGMEVVEVGGGIWQAYGSAGVQGDPLLLFNADQRGTGHIDFLSAEPGTPGEKNPLLGKSLVVHEAFSQLARGEGLIPDGQLGEQVACGVVE